MMKKITVKARWAGLMALWAANALAGIGELPAPQPGMSVQDTPAQTARVVGEGSKALRAGPTKARTLDRRPILRCWQYGQLIFEEPIASMPPNLAGQGYMFKDKAGSQSVQLLSIHTATCIIK